MVGVHTIVINPNSTRAVTDGIRDAVRQVPGIERLDVDYLTLAEGPPGIETDAHIRAVIPPLQALVREREADAFVIACFSDPGVAQLRGKPVYGIGECACRAAAAGNRRFGIISILAPSVARHRRHLERLGLAAQLAGDRPLGLSVLDLADHTLTAERMREVARRLVSDDGAEALVLGCAGMAAYREAVQADIGCPVIDPCQAALQAVLRDCATPAQTALGQYPESAR